MRHLRSGRKLNRSATHRKALKANMATSILEKERIMTTLAKAKEIRSTVERLITYGKKGGLHAIRLAARIIKNEDVLKKLFSDIAPGYKDRKGGYTRIVKHSFRQGDNADMAIIELVGRRGEEPRKKPKKKLPSMRRKPAAPGSPVEKPQENDTKSQTENTAAEDNAANAPAAASARDNTPPS
jgi:large subunit ribosomal protein L17